jgi:hypothetical protein
MNLKIIIMLKPEILGIFIPILAILTTGFVIYVYYTSRTKERLLQIEKGVDSSFLKNNRTYNSKNLVVFGVFLISIGIGVFVGALLTELGLDRAISYNGSLLILGGIGLLVGYFLRKKMSD